MIRTCPGCGCDPGVSKGRKPRKWCSEKCRFAHTYRTSPAYRAKCAAAKAEKHRRTYVPASHTKTCQACGADFVARNAGRRSCSDRCRYRLNYLARRGRKAGVASEPYTPIEIADRDGWVCQLCFEPVERGVRYPDLLSPSIDHRVPLARGGDDTRANVQLAHLDCNRRKWAKTMPDPKRGGRFPKREARHASTEEACEYSS